MRLGFHTSGLQNHRLAEALELIATHGYQVVALTLDVMHLDPYRSTPAEVREIRARLDALGLGVTIETGARFLLDPGTKHDPTLMSRDRAARARRLDFYSRAARVGAALGAEVVSFWAGIDPAPGPDSFGWLCEGVGLACAAIRAEGLAPAFEPEPGMAVATPAGYLALARALGDAGPDLCLDIGHLYVTEPDEPLASIPTLGPRLRQVHLEDMRRGRHEHLLPGEGDVDFRAVHSSLAAAGYPGPVCFELSRHSHMAPQALARCRDAWARARD